MEQKNFSEIVKNELSSIGAYRSDLDYERFKEVFFADSNNVVCDVYKPRIIMLDTQVDKAAYLSATMKEFLSETNRDPKLYTISYLTNFELRANLVRNVYSEKQREQIPTEFQYPPAVFLINKNKEIFMVQETLVSVIDTHVLKLLFAEAGM